MADHNVSVSLDGIQCSSVNYSIFSNNVAKWKPFVFLTWFGLSSVTSVTLNAGVFILFYSHKHLRTSSNTFFLSLAFADFLIGGFVIPWKVTCYIVVPPTAGILILAIFVDYILSAAFLSICGLTYDRYQAIINPLTYPMRVSSKTARRLCAVVWVVPAVHFLRAIWLLSPQLPARKMDLKFTIFLIGAMIALTSLVILAYCLIFKEANNQRNSVKIIGLTGKTGITGNLEESVCQTEQQLSIEQTRTGKNGKIGMNRKSTEPRNPEQTFQTGETRKTSQTRITEKTGMNRKSTEPGNPGQTCQTGETIKTSQTRNSGKVRMSKAIRSCLAVTLCFTCCWIPRAIFMGRMFLGYPRNYKWDLVTFGLMVLSSCLNPILYSICSRDIRKAILKTQFYSLLKGFGKRRTIILS